MTSLNPEKVSRFGIQHANTIMETKSVLCVSCYQMKKEKQVTIKKAGEASKFIYCFGNLLAINIRLETKEFTYHCLLWLLHCKIIKSKVCIRAKWSVYTAGAYPEKTRNISIPPLGGMLVHRRVTPQTTMVR